MRRVILESPFAAESAEGIARHVQYARSCVRDCLKRGEAPLASHLLYTQPGVLADNVPEERVLGMNAGFAWTLFAQGVVVYTDFGISNGMKRGIEVAEKAGVPIEYRSLER